MAFDAWEHLEQINQQHNSRRGGAKKFCIEIFPGGGIGCHTLLMLGYSGSVPFLTSPHTLPPFTSLLSHHTRCAPSHLSSGGKNKQTSGGLFPSNDSWNHFGSIEKSNHKSHTLCVFFVQKIKSHKYAACVCVSLCV